MSSAGGENKVTESEEREGTHVDKRKTGAEKEEAKGRREANVFEARWKDGGSWIRRERS